MREQDPLRSIRAMLAAAPSSALIEVGRALQAKLNQSTSPSEQRLGQLGLLATCVRAEARAGRGWRAVTIESYEARRRLCPGAPSAETLARRYGSWKGTCRAASLLRTDGSVPRRGAWVAGVSARPRTKPYSRQECIDSVRAATVIGRRPSSSAYAAWRRNRMARARASGEEIRLAPVRRILVELAPERDQRDGWRIVLEKALGSGNDR